MIKSSSNLKKAKWPLKTILQSPLKFQNSIDLRKTKLYEGYTIDKLGHLNNNINDLIGIREKAAAQRNSLVKQIKSNVGKQIEKDSLQGDLLAKSKVLKEELKVAEDNLNRERELQDRVLESIPNLIAEKTALLGEKEYEVIGYLNKAEPVPLERNHVDIGTKLNILDLMSGSKVSGTGHYYLIGLGAMLEQALVQYSLEKCRELGFVQVSVPHIVRNEFTVACGFRPRDQNNEVQVYSVNGGSGQTDLCLAGTAEIPIAAWKAHSTVDAPYKVCGLSRSFRAEAGARGADTRGLYRVHEFTKVEMFAWTKNDIDESTKTLEELLEHQKEIIGSLGLNTRILRIGPSDLGAPAYEKYDLEAWMPGRKQWGEVSSVSNCLDYQSRRLWTVDGNGDFVHTLNGTALAIPRIIVAIIENNYDPATNQIRVPQVLHKWMPEYIS